MCSTALTIINVALRHHRPQPVACAIADLGTQLLAQGARQPTDLGERNTHAHDERTAQIGYLVHDELACQCALRLLPPTVTTHATHCRALSERIPARYDTRDDGLVYLLLPRVYRQTTVIFVVAADQTDLSKADSARVDGLGPPQPASDTRV